MNMKSFIFRTIFTAIVFGFVLKPTAALSALDIFRIVPLTAQLLLMVFETPHPEVHLNPRIYTFQTPSLTKAYIENTSRLDPKDLFDFIKYFPNKKLMPRGVDFHDELKLRGISRFLIGCMVSTLKFGDDYKETCSLANQYKMEEVIKTGSINPDDLPVICIEGLTQLKTLSCYPTLPKKSPIRKIETTTAAPTDTTGSTSIILNALSPTNRTAY